MKVMDDPYLELAAAILKTAIIDYKAAYKHLLRHPESKAAQEGVEREKKFFYGGWFEMLSDLDGPTLVRMVEEKVKEDLKKEEDKDGEIHTT